MSTTFAVYCSVFHHHIIQKYDTAKLFWYFFVLGKQGFYDVALRKEAERRAEAEEEYQVICAFNFKAPLARACYLLCIFFFRLDRK